MPDNIKDSDISALEVALRVKIARSEKFYRIRRAVAETRAMHDSDAAWVRVQALKAAANIDQRASRYSVSPSTGVLEALTRAKKAYSQPGSGKLDLSALEAFQSTPAARLLADILTRWGLSKWQDCEPGSVAVFSNHPHNREFSLDADSKSLSKYLALQEKYSSWAWKSGKVLVDEGSQWILPKIPFVQGDRTLLLTVSREQEVPEFNLRIYDQHGTMESEALLPLSEFGPKPQSKAKKKLGTAELSSETIEAIAGVSPRSPSFRFELLDPVRYEPLNTYVKDCLVAYSKARGFARVVGVVPDSFLYTLQHCVEVSR